MAGRVFCVFDDENQKIVVEDVKGFSVSLMMKIKNIVLKRLIT